ncbi:hypothetical protein GCM10027416_02720 [Okibacterium endophyticum]
MQLPSLKTRTITSAVLTPVAIIAAAALIWQSSYAAFTGSTRNSGNNWSTGSVALTDDDAGAARFQAADMVPGATDTKCITVTANTSVPGVVKAYAVNPVLSPAGLQDHIMVNITYGTGGGFGSCDGFVEQGVAVPSASLTSFASINTFEEGIGGWNIVAGTQSRTYKLTWTFDTTGMTQLELDRLQGASTGIDMQWELQSN